MTGLLRTIIAAAWMLLALAPAASAESGTRLVIMPKLLRIDHHDAVKRRIYARYPGLRIIDIRPARAVKETGLAGKIAVVSNSRPNLMRSYLKDGTMKKALLWNASDHGYLTMYCVYLLATGGLKPGTPFRAGRLSAFMPKKNALSMQVTLPVLTFTKENVHKHHF